MSRKRKILVVDDDPDIVDASRAILESAGYEVDSAANGTEALEKVRSGAPDLVLLDIMMDRETEGFHVSYELKEDEETKDIPIIVLTAIGQKSGFSFSPEQDGDYLPVEDYIEKPLEPEVLLEKIGALLGDT